MKISKREQIEFLVVLLAILLAILNLTGRFNNKLLVLKKDIEDIKAKQELLKEVGDLYRIAKEREKQCSLKTDLRAIIYSSAKDCRVSIQAIVPKREVRYLGLTSQEMLVELKGEFPNLVCFVKDVERTDRGFILVRAFKISRQELISNKLARYYATIRVVGFKPEKD